MTYLFLIDNKIKMSKQISQETYNQVVNENIDEFSMSQEEAIEDAVKQFEAQVNFPHDSYSNMQI